MELCLHNNTICVYSWKDWKKLRQECRIIGECLGSTQTTPSLPIVLLPEETLLLINKNIAKLVQYPNLQNPPTVDNYNDCKKLETELLEAELRIYQNQRKKDLEQIIDKIVDAKTKKGVEVSRESVLSEEINKVNVTTDTMIWPILTESVDRVKGVGVDVPISTVAKQTTATKTAVFADLWEKGYYVTSGTKFGGDFLVYAGDPIAFHALYIIRCLDDSSQELHPSELVAFGRLGTSVKKKSVLASLCDNNVDYITINWMDM